MNSFYCWFRHPNAAPATVNDPLEHSVLAITLSALFLWYLYGKDSSVRRLGKICNISFICNTLCYNTIKIYQLSHSTLLLKTWTKNTMIFFLLNLNVQQEGDSFLEKLKSKVNKFVFFTKKKTWILDYIFMKCLIMHSNVINKKINIVRWLT